MHYYDWEEQLLYHRVQLMHFPVKTDGAICTIMSHSDMYDIVMDGNQNLDRS